MIRLLLLSFTLLFFLSCLPLQAQEWVEKMQNPQTNFYEVKSSFEAFYGNKPIEKGTGWKQYKRWEYFAMLDMDEQGNRPAPTRVQTEVQNFLASHPQPLSTTGSWTELGPIAMPVNNTSQPNGLGRINCVAFHPTNVNILFVGAPSGGLWRSTNGGTTWISNTDNLPTLGVSSIVFDHSNPSIVYIGTGDRDAADAPGLGVRKSIDGGVTWATSNTGMGNRTVGKMLMHPSNSSILIAATSGGIYRTTNAGANWTLVSTSANFKDIRFKPGDPDIVYATASGVFYRSTNNGINWSTVSIPITGSRAVLGVSPADANVVYITQTSGPFAGLMRSTNSGASFTTMSTTPNIMDYECDGSGTRSQAWYNLCMAVDPLNANIIYVGGINIWKSIDGGATWTINTHWTFGGCGSGKPAVHADIHSLDFNPLNNRLFSGHDGGVHWTSNGGSTWTEISNGLAIAQIYKIGQSATVKNRVINGYQDNGTATFSGTGFNTVIGGDGMECIVDHSNSNILYGSLYYGDIRRSVNGSSFSVIGREGSNGITEEGAWVTPYIQHPTAPATLFAGYRNLWRTTNSTASPASTVSWTSLTTLSGSGTMRAIKQSAANTNVLYFTRNSGERLVRSDNINAVSPSFNSLDGFMGTPGRPVAIETHPTSAEIVYVTNNSGGVFRSINRGQSWTNISTGLPNLTINSIVYEKGSNEGLYVGTSAGVYYKDSTMGSWQLFNTGLPTNSRITELEIWYHPTDRAQSRIRASTYGRGLWESPLYSSSPVAIPVADFSVNTTTITTGQSVNFTDLSTNSPTAWSWTFTGATTTSSTLQNPSGISYNSVGCYAVTLTSSNAVGPSAPVTKTCYINVLAPTYCIPNPTNGTSDGDFIQSVSLGSINNLNTGSITGPNYTFYSSLSTNLNRGTAYTLNITGGTYQPDVYAAWIDYNKDADFDDVGEKLGEFVTNSTNQAFSINFTVPSGASLGNTRLRVRVAYNAANMNPCTNYSYGETEDYVVSIQSSSPLPTASLTRLNSSSNICQGTNAQMRVTLTGVAPWSIQLSRNGVLTTINAIASSPYTYQTLISNPGVDTFRIASVSDGSTQTSINQGNPVIYQTSASPSVSNAGTNQSVCATSATLNANNPTIGTGQWSSLGSAVVTNPIQRNSGVSGLAVGGNAFVWTISNGACAPSRDTVFINRSASPSVSNAGTDQSVCATTATLNANNPTIGTGQWSSLGSAVVTNPTQRNSSVSGLAVGGNAFVWTISNGACAPSRDTVFINRSASPSVSNAGTDQSVCATTATLNANNPTIGTGQWSSIGSAVVTNPTQRNSGVSGLAVGNNAFVWTISNGACAPSRDTVVINAIHPFQMFLTSNMDSSCLPDNIILTRSGNAPSGTNFELGIQFGNQMPILLPFQNDSVFIFTPTQAGVHNFTLISEVSACSFQSTAQVLVQICSGFGEVPLSIDRPRVFPNPSNGIYYLEFSSPMQSIESISLFDSKGAVVRNLEFDWESNNRLKITMINVANGIYHLKWFNGADQGIVKLVKQ